MCWGECGERRVASNHDHWTAPGSAGWAAALSWAELSRVEEGGSCVELSEIAGQLSPGSRDLASSHRGHVTRSPPITAAAHHHVTWPALTGVTWPGLHQSQPLLIIIQDVGHNLQMEEWRHPRCDDGSVWVVMGTPSQYLLLLAACCDPGILPSRAEPSPALFRTG